MEYDSLRWFALRRLLWFAPALQDAVKWLDEVDCMLLSNFLMVLRASQI